jgi:hypothetical protein
VPSVECKPGHTHQGKETFMYPSYPGNAQLPQTQQPPPVVRTAIRVMYAGATASLLAIVVDLATLNATKDALASRHPDLTTSQVAAQQAPLMVGWIVGGLAAVALWIVIARACADGKGWARPTGTVLLVVATADAFANLALPEAAAVKIFWWVIWLIGLVAVLLLWRRDSSAFFGRPNS